MNSTRNSIEAKKAFQADTIDSMSSGKHLPEMNKTEHIESNKQR